MHDIWLSSKCFVQIKIKEISINYNNYYNYIVYLRCAHKHYDEQGPYKIILNHYVDCANRVLKRVLSHKFHQPAAHPVLVVRQLLQ